MAANSRERVIRAIDFDCPDRIPIMHAFLPAATAKLGENTVKDIFDKYPYDFADVYQYSTMPADPLYQKGIRRDDWGCIWVNARDGILGQVKEHPLKDLKTLRDYEPPDPLSDPYFTQVEKYLSRSLKATSLITTTPIFNDTSNDDSWIIAISSSESTSNRLSFKLNIAN